MKYFISSKWRNRDKVLNLTAKLRDKGKEVYCFFESPMNVDSENRDPEEVMREFEAITDWRNNDKIKNVFEDTANKIKDSDTVILLLPAGSSAHIEIGIAYGLRKKCILIGQIEKTESMYLIFSESYNSIDDFIESL